MVSNLFAQSKFTRSFVFLKALSKLIIELNIVIHHKRVNIKLNYLKGMAALGRKGLVK